MSERINDAMRDPSSLLGDDNGNVTCYCAEGHLVGYIPVSMAKNLVRKGWDYVLTTQDTVSTHECCCPKKK